MEKEQAEFLAYETIREYEQMPLVGSSKIKIENDRLTKIIQGIPLRRDDSQRERFFSSLSKSERTFYDVEMNPTKTLEIIGLITNYRAGYSPNSILRRIRAKEESIEERKENPESIEDAENINPNNRVICRKIRKTEEIVEMRKASYKSGNKYSLFAEYGVYRSCQGKAGGAIWWRLPVVFIPGINDSDLIKTLKVCLDHQIPSKQVSDKWFSEKVVDL